MHIKLTMQLSLSWFYSQRKIKTRIEAFYIYLLHYNIILDTWCHLALIILTCIQPPSLCHYNAYPSNGIIWDILFILCFWIKWELKNGLCTCSRASLLHSPFKGQCIYHASVYTVGSWLRIFSMIWCSLRMSYLINVTFFNS